MRYDPITGNPLPFNLTKRRREVLYWIAYGPAHGAELQVHAVRWPYWRKDGYAGHAVEKITLHGTDVTQIVHLLRRQRLVKKKWWLLGPPAHWQITPAGMVALLEEGRE